MLTGLSVRYHGTTVMFFAVDLDRPWLSVTVKTTAKGRVSPYAWLTVVEAVVKMVPSPNDHK